MQVNGRVARVEALAEQRHGELVHFSGGGRGWVVALRHHETDVVWLDERPEPGDCAHSAGPLTVGVPPTPRGVFDALGDPEGPRVPLLPGRRPWTWPHEARRLDLGPLVFDLRLRVTTGQAVLMVHRHPMWLRHLMQDQAIRGRTVVYMGAGPLSCLVDGVAIVGNTDTQSALAPLGALAIGHALAIEGRDVVLVIDRPASWRVRAAGHPGLPSWPTLLDRVTGAVWTGPAGSLSLWLVSELDGHGLPPGIDHVLDLRQLCSGDPKAQSRLVRPVYKVRPTADLGRWVRSTSAGDAEAARIRGLLRYRGPQSPDVALATFVGLAQAGLHENAWDAFAAIVEQDTALRDAIRAGGGVDEAARGRLRLHAQALQRNVADSTR